MPEEHEPPRSVRVRLRGQVQGVGFRAWTVSEADRLGLDGWVRNLRDGSVEAVFSGEPATVCLMLERVRQGPRGSLVTELMIDEDLEAPATGFNYRPTA